MFFESQLQRNIGGMCIPTTSIYDRASEDFVMQAHLFCGTFAFQTLAPVSQLLKRYSGTTGRLTSPLCLVLFLIIGQNLT